jgi:hypothetical protein
VGTRSINFVRSSFASCQKKTKQKNAPKSATTFQEQEQKEREN